MLVEGGLLLLCGALAFVCAFSLHSKDKQMNGERELWQAERKDLLDRIQAPTYQEYTNKVIREKKADKPEEPKPDNSQYIS